MTFWQQPDNKRREYFEYWYYTKNLSWREIAKQLHTYPNKVSRDAKKLGVTSRDHSQAQTVALREGRQEHPTKGKSRSDLTKLRISEKQGKVWDNLSSEDRQKRRDIGKESWNKKTDREKEYFFQRSTEAIQEASRNGSKVEKYIYQLLLEAGYLVDKHKEHILQNEKFHLDLYIPSCRTAIEIDGPMHFEPVFGDDKLQRRQAADASKNGLILSSGMVLIRVKLVQRDSQRYLRNLGQQVLGLLKKIEFSFPPFEERLITI